METNFVYDWLTEDYTLEMLYRKLHYLRIKLNKETELKLKISNPEICLEQLHKKINNTYLKNKEILNLKCRIKELENNSFAF